MSRGTIRGLLIVVGAALLLTVTFSLSSRVVGALFGALRPYERWRIAWIPE
jgi:hypothetical protein